MVEVRKKLIGDTGDTLITPYRVGECVLIQYHIMYLLCNRNCSYGDPDAASGNMCQSFVSG